MTPKTEKCPPHDVAQDAISLRKYCRICGVQELPEWSSTPPLPEQERRQPLTIEQWVESLRESCHDNYNGGHHDDIPREAFHHGMDTVCNVLGNGGALKRFAASQVSGLQDELKRMREALNDAVGAWSELRCYYISAPQVTVEKMDLALAASQKGKGSV